MEKKDWLDIHQPRFATTIRNIEPNGLQVKAILITSCKLQKTTVVVGCSRQKRKV
jgi:hypothetical protein